MVQANAHLSVVATRIAERVLYLRLAARCGAREVIIAHGYGDWALQRDLMIVVDAIGLCWL